MPSESSVARCVIAEVGMRLPINLRATEKTALPMRPIHSFDQNSVSTSRRRCSRDSRPIVLISAIGPEINANPI